MHLLWGLTAVVCRADERSLAHNADGCGPHERAAHHAGQVVPQRARQVCLMRVQAACACSCLVSHTYAPLLALLA